MTLGVSVDLPVGPHHDPYWDPLVLLGDLVQSQLLGKGFVSRHHITA